MKCRVYSIKWGHDELDKKYPCLKDYGFEYMEFIKEIPTYLPMGFIFEGDKFLKQVELKKVRRPIIHVYSMEELSMLIEKLGAHIVLDRSSEIEGAMYLEIYDGPRESEVRDGQN